MIFRKGAKQSFLVNGAEKLDDTLNKDANRNCLARGRGRGAL